MTQLIHMVLGISGYFTFWCCLMVGWMLYAAGGDLWNSDRDSVEFLIVMAALCLALTALGTKRKFKYELPLWITADFFITYFWCYFFVYQETLSWIHLDSSIRAIYAIACFLVFFTDSTRRLSPTKVAIAATFFTPLVVFGLLIYNNKNSVDEVENYLLRAKSAIEDGGYEVAITSVTKAIDICPRNIEETNYYLSKCYYLRWKAYRHAGEFQKAQKDLWKAEDLARKRKDKSFLASIKLEQSNNEIANNIDDGYAYQQRGEAYMNRMEANPEEDFTDVAIADFNKAIELDDQEAYAFAQRGLLYAEKKGDYEQAIADCTKAIEIASAKDYANWVIALAYRTRRKVYLKMGDKEKAEADYATAHQLEENMSEQESAFRAARLGRI